jgi:hypothetical protein
MTDVPNYVSDAPESRQRARKSKGQSAFLPPDRSEKRDSLGRPVRPREEDDGQVKYRPTHQLASHRLKSILVERALESEAINAPLVAALNIGGRPDRLTAPLEDIYDTVLDYFRSTNLTLAELRDTNRRLGMLSYVRSILIEIMGRHSRLSIHAFALKFGVDHSTVSYTRARIRNILSFNDIESRALRADLNAITVALSNKLGWASGGRSFDNRRALAQRLESHIKTLNLVWANGVHPHFSQDRAKISEDIAEACKILVEGDAP